MKPSGSAGIDLQLLLFLAVSLGGTAASVSGQTTRLAVLAGASQFDLSGTGTAFMVALRGDRAWPTRPAVLLEAGVGVSFPRQQLGAKTTFVVPEIGVQLQLPRRVAPYVGLGAGAAMDFRPEPFDNRIDFALSVAAGARAALSDALGLRAELRVRGVDLNVRDGAGFTGTTAEWTGGISWTP